MRIPIAAPGRMHPEEAAAVRAAVAAVADSGCFVGGPFVDSFEAAFARRIGADVRCATVASGQDALVLALAAMDLPDEAVVLVPPNDGGFAAAAVQAVGLVPHQVDVGPDGLVGADQVAESWTPQVRAIVVTHLHGLVADIGPVVELCRARRALVLEDCAQAHGAGGAAIHGDAAAFSFYPTKNLGALGDGGAVVTRNPVLDRRVRQLRQYGWGERFRIAHPLGRNSRLDEVQAAVLGARLPFLDRNNAARREIVLAYAWAAPAAVFLARPDESFVAHHAVVVDDARDALAAELRAAGIGHDVHYPWLVSEMPGIRQAGSTEAPVADGMRRRILSLPCFPGLRPDEVAAVGDALMRWSGRVHG